MTKPISQNQDLMARASEVYNDVTTSRPWRHTAGRISMLARIPIYLIGLGLQTAKIAVKAVISPLGSFAAWAFNTKKLDAWTFSGVGKDSLIWVRLADKIGNSAIGVITAPPKEYYSFYDGAKGAVKAVILGDYHEGKLSTLENVAFKVRNQRAQYSKIIFQNEDIRNQTAITKKLIVKAG